MQKTAKEPFVAEYLHVKCLPELKRLVALEADKSYPSTINEVIVRVLAKHYGRPELGITPRKRMGRPRKEPA